jgi:hypothetical protein
LTNHIALPEAISKLSRHTAYAEIVQKSTTPYEGLLPIEGDALYSGQEEQTVQLRHFVGRDKMSDSSRTPSRHSSYHGDARDSMAMSPPLSATNSSGEVSASDLPRAPSEGGN